MRNFSCVLGPACLELKVSFFKDLCQGHKILLAFFLSAFVGNKSVPKGLFILFLDLNSC
jgi:hypothetical protein